MTLPDLISQIEAAVEGSRELDAEIFCLVKYPHLRPQRNFFYINRGEWGVFESNQPHPGLTFHDAPHYTTSLDAAMTLVPEDSFVDHLGQNHANGWTALVSHKSDEDASQYDGIAPTPALALVLACLRAKAGSVTG